MADARLVTPLLTVGHGTLAAEDFVALLSRAGVAEVVDVRRYPRSRRHPQHNRERLAATLVDAGLRYRWEEALGGRRSVAADSLNIGLRDRSFRGYADHMGTAAFRDAVSGLLGDLGHGTVTLMCAESLWWRCHRRLIADHLVLVEDVPVEHLLHDGRREPHALTDTARRDRSRVVYDVGSTPPLRE